MIIETNQLSVHSDREINSLVEKWSFDADDLSLRQYEERLAIDHHALGSPEHDSLEHDSETGHGNLGALVLEGIRDLGFELREGVQRVDDLAEELEEGKEVQDAVLDAMAING